MSTDPEITSGNDPNDPDTEGRAVPPYEGRRETADVDGGEQSEKDGAKTAGATGPVEDDDMKATPKEDTARGAEASPSDEQPASESSDTDLDPDMTGPAHTPGIPRGEDSGA
jgi:hypothetical protein